MTDNKKEYPPEIKVKYAPASRAGMQRIKVRPMQMNVGTNDKPQWVNRTDGSTVAEAHGVNAFDVVLAYPDAFKINGQFPVRAYGGGTVDISWTMFYVGPVPLNEDGQPRKGVPVFDVSDVKVEERPLPVAFRYKDRSTNHYMYERMTRIINEVLATSPGTTIRDHVFSFGKKEGSTPQGQWTFDYHGRLSELYPGLTLPAQGGLDQPQAPAASIPAQAATAPAPSPQIAPPPPPSAPATASVPVAVAPVTVDVFGTTAPANPNNGFTPTDVEIRIAAGLRDQVRNMGSSLAALCASRGMKPGQVIFNTFAKGVIPDGNGGKLKTDDTRAQFIADNPHVVGIDPDAAPE